MPSSWLIIVLVAASISLHAQQTVLRDADDLRVRFPEGQPLNAYDSLGLLGLPELTIPENLRTRGLPDLVDNSSLQYLRPVFSQVGASCGQAAAVGYNFTYEIDCYRNLPADTSIHQYPTHFTWNFMNGGNGWYGVSYFHSFEILKYCGNMNVADYGGDYFDDGIRWISGYDVYYNAMLNRIDEAYTIRTDTEEGILTLKNWIFDHLDFSESGGVASFYSNPPYGASQLNDTTPEGGKYVVTAFYPAATHAMTIVGYNDSIRWDYNGDGQYTNDLDIDADGELTPRDWEIGGFKVVNSYGNFLDSGFYYMMYKVAAETFNNGGIWNQCVHVVDISENYQPLLTYKVSLTHNRRGKIKVTAGVSTDTDDLRPEWTMEFPIFDYQGGAHYMQGQDTAEYLKTIEFGLDVTPLLSYLVPGQPARFFLMVDENDPFNEGQGSVNWFSLWDYTGTPAETVCQQAPLDLLDHNKTVLMVDHAAGFDPVIITTANLPAFTPGQPYTADLEATGGSGPYLWDLVQDYHRFPAIESLPDILEDRLMPNVENDTVVAVPMPFSFPYYGKTYDTVYAHVDGYLLFKEEHLPWPYSDDERLFLKSNRLIAPLANAYFVMNSVDDGVWHESDAARVIFRWKISDELNPGLSDYQFGLALYPSGEIELYTGSITNPENLRTVSGISAGDKMNFMLAGTDDQECLVSNESARFRPSWFPPGMKISGNGTFQGMAPSGDTIYDIIFKVTDSRRISTSRKLPFTAGPWIGLYIDGEPQETALFGDTVSFNLVLRNYGASVLEGMVISLSEANPYCHMIDSLETTGALSPGDSLIVPGALSFAVSPQVPDLFPLIINADLDGGELAWQQQFILIALSPRLHPDRFSVEDGDDHILEPGETAPVLIQLLNSGHADISSVNGTLVSLDERIEILGNPEKDFGNILKSQFSEATFDLSADSSVPTGFKALFVLSWTSAEGLSGSDTLTLRIGKIPVLVLDLDPNRHSGPVIESVLNELGVIADYSPDFPSLPSQYFSIFLCLGIHFSNHILSWSEGEMLAQYLQQGGRIYLESRETWLTDPQTPLQPMFSLAAQDQVILMNNLDGQASTFTAGMSFDNTAEHPFNFFYIDPVYPAYTIFTSQDDGRSCAVAYDQGTYRTIGTIFEFGALAGSEPPSTLRELMKQYLTFFGIFIPPVGIDDDGTISASAQVVKVTPNPSTGRFDFSIALAEDSGITLEIFSATGNFRQTVASERHPGKGISMVTWNAPTQLPAGIYIYRLQTKGHSFVGKLVLLR